VRRRRGGKVNEEGVNLLMIRGEGEGVEREGNEKGRVEEVRTLPGVPGQVKLLVWLLRMDSLNLL